MSTAGKPSREKLEEYYKTSRQYFDDMAEHYKESDPDYYNSTIAPIIRKNRFSGDVGGAVAKRGLILTSVAALVVLGIAMAVFFMLTPGKPETNPVDEMYEKLNEDGTQRSPAPIRETTPTIESENDGTDEGLDENMTNFDKGVFYYDQAAYDQALKYFGQVKPGTPNYDQAQKYVSEISNMSDEERMGISPNGDAPQQNPIKK